VTPLEIGAEAEYFKLSYQYPSQTTHCTSVLQKLLCGLWQTVQDHVSLIVSFLYIMWKTRLCILH